MGAITAAQRKKLQERLAELWDEATLAEFRDKNLEEKQPSARSLQMRMFASCMRELIEKVDITEVYLWLDQLSDIATTKDLKKFNELLDATNKTSANKLSELAKLTQWIAQLQDRTANRLSGLAINFSKKQKKATLSALQAKIKETRNLLSQYYQKDYKEIIPQEKQGQYLQRCLYQAVNEDNFEELKTILDDNLDLNLNNLQIEVMDLFRIAYLRRDYFNLNLDEKTQSTYQSSIEKAEKKRREENENIVMLLLDKINVNSVTKDQTSILRFATNNETPPSDLIYFILKGANPYFKDANGKEPIDYLFKKNKGSFSLKDEQMFLHKEILAEGIPNLFMPSKYLLLENIMQDRKGQTINLFDQLVNNWPEAVNKLTTDDQKGMLMYHLLNSTNTEMAKKALDKLTIDEKKQVSQWIQAAGKEIYRIKNVYPVGFYKCAAELGNHRSMYDLGFYYNHYSTPPDLIKAVELYAKSYAGQDNNDRNDVINRLRIIIENNDTNSEVKGRAITELNKIYHLRWKENQLIDNLLEMLEMLAYMENNSSHGFNEEKKQLYEQIINNPWIPVLEALPEKEKIGEILYNLLAHPHTELKNYIKTYIEENKSTLTIATTGIYINNVGVKLLTVNKNKASQYFQLSAELGSLFAMFNLGYTHFHHHSVKQRDLKKAVHLYQESYASMSEGYQKIILSDLKLLSNNTENREEKRAAISGLIKINRIRWNPPDQYLTEQIDFINFLKKISTDEQQKNDLYQWINDALEKIINSDKKPQGVGQLLYSLLTPTRQDAKLAEYTKTFLAERNLTRNASQLILEAGNKIGATDKTSAANYYKTSADMGNYIALFNLANYHRCNNNFSAAIPLYLKSYPHLGNDQDKCIDHLIEICSKATTIEDKKAAISVLTEIFLGRFKTLNLAQRLAEQAKFVAILDTMPEIYKEQRNEIYEQVINSWENVLEFDCKTADEKAAFLYSLLVPPDTTVAKSIMALIHEKKLAPKLSLYMNIAGVNIFKNFPTRAGEYYEMASNWRNCYGMWNLANFYHKHANPKDLRKAAELYKQSYAHWTTDKDRQEVASRLTEIWYVGYYAGKIALNEIDTLHQKTLQSLKIAIEVLPTPLSDKNMQFITLNNGKEKMVSPEIATQWYLINEAMKNNKKNMDEIINLLHDKEPPVPEFKAYYAIFKEKNSLQTIITKCAKYQEHYLSSVTYWADQPDGILKLLEIQNDKVGNRNEQFSMERYSAILSWINKFGNAANFFKIDQARQQLLSHRILEHIFSPSKDNRLALNLEKRLIELWKKDTGSEAKQLLHDFYTKKIQFLELHDNKKDEIALINKELSDLTIHVKHINSSTETKGSQKKYFQLFKKMVTGNLSNIEKSTSKFKK